MVGDKLSAHFANVVKPPSAPSAKDSPFNYAYTARGLDELSLLTRAYFDLGILPQAGGMLNQDMSLMADIYAYEHYLKHALSGGKKVAPSKPKEATPSKVRVVKTLDDML